MAKASGDGALLWPKGCDKVEDVPWELSVAIGHAFRILHWQENLMSEEMPPSWKWPFESELDLHFERVQTERDAKYGNNSSSNDDDDGGTPMMSNALAGDRGSKA